jgi:hypothetical protein
MTKIALIVAFGALSCGCSESLLLPGGTKVPRKEICDYDNCGAAGTVVVHPNPETPLMIGDKAEDLTFFLGQFMNPGNVYAAPRVCSGPISDIQISKTYNTNKKIKINSTEQTRLATTLKAKIGGDIGATAAKANLDALIDKAVTETISANYVVSTRTYTLKPDAFADRKKVCGAQTDASAVVYSISVVTLSADVQQALTSKLKQEIAGNAALQAAIWGADASASAKRDETVDRATETAVESVAMVVAIGFDRTP